MEVPASGGTSEPVKLIPQPMAPRCLPESDSGGLEAVPHCCQLPLTHASSPFVYSAVSPYYRTKLRGLYTTAKADAEAECK